jgi:hypothetical protein
LASSGRRLGRIGVVCAVLAMTWAGSAPHVHAAPVAAAEASTAGQWQISVTPYAWMPALKGDMAVSSRLPAAHVDASSGDVLDSTGFALMGTVDVRRARFVASSDLFFANLKVSKGVGVRDPDFLHAGVGAKQFIWTALAGYRLVDHDTQFVDLFGGLRLVDLDESLDLSGPVRNLKGSTRKTWADPIVGLRLGGPLGDKWGYSAYGDIGGFGAASKLTWELQATIDYRISRDWTLSGGWRHLDIDYRNDGFVFDAGLDGPLLSGTYRF